MQSRTLLTLWGVKWLVTFACFIFSITMFLDLYVPPYRIHVNTTNANIVLNKHYTLKESC